MFPVQAASARTLMRRLDRIPLCNKMSKGLCLPQRDTLRTRPASSSVSPTSVYIDWKNRKFLYFCLFGLDDLFSFIYFMACPNHATSSHKAVQFIHLLLSFSWSFLFKIKGRKKVIFFFFLLCTFLRPLDVVGMSPKQFPQL